MIVRPFAAAIGVALVMGSLPQVGFAQIHLPNLDLKPSDINPFNPNSKVREELAEFDKQRLQTTKDASNFVGDEYRKAEKFVKDEFHKVESWTSEQLFEAYRDYYVAKNRNLKGYHLQEADDHYKMIYPLLGKEIDLKTVTFYFGAQTPPGMCAITFENQVYVQAEHCPDSLYQGGLLAHETTHSVQYARLGGWKGFARRYAGQIGKSIRDDVKGAVVDGTSTNLSCFHDTLDLEKEAIATEIRLGELTPGGVAITNRTRHLVHYALRPHQEAKWQAFSLKPGETEVHSYPLVLADRHYLDPQIQFDHSYTEGFQGTVYALDPQFHLNRKGPLPETDAEAYHFEETPDHLGIDLFTGKGRPPEPIKTIKATFHNTTKQMVAFHLNGGSGLDTSLDVGKTNTFNLVVDPGVVPAITIKQAKGKPLAFTVVDGAEYDIRMDGEQIKNSYHGRGNAPLFSGTWVGAWSNSVGEKGKETLTIDETEAGVITGTWSNVQVKGHRADAYVIELTGQTKTRSYRITGHVVKDVMTLAYTATRLDKGGSYEGKARLVHGGKLSYEPHAATDARSEKLSFAGKWAGEWKSSLGEKGKDGLELIEEKDGKLSGAYTWTDAMGKGGGEMKLMGHRVNNTTAELRGTAKNRSYQITATLQGNTLHLRYLAARLDADGSYDGSSEMKK